MPVEYASGDHQTDTQQTDDDPYMDGNVSHLEKMTDYKSYAKGLMDIALMSANANQLRNALEMRTPYSTVLTGMISASLLLQVIATIILVVERMTCRKHDYLRCHRYNIAIAVIVVLIIFINIFIAAFGVPSEQPVNVLPTTSESAVTASDDGVSTSTVNTLSNEVR